MSVRESVIRIVASAFPALTYSYPRTYVVGKVYARGVDRVDLVPPPDARWLDDLTGVSTWSLGGARVQPVVGAEVIVVFRDADKRRPVIAGYAVGVPQALDLGASEGAGELVARLTDGANGGGVVFANKAPAGTGITITYTPPGVAVPQIVGLSGAITVDPPPAAPGFALRAVIDDVGQDKVYA